MNPLEPAYVLHSRAYGETSAILDVFTEQYGRFNAVLRGVRNAKSQKRAYTQPFTPLLITFHGRGELQTITSIEAEKGRVELTGTALYSGLYLNELLTRLLPKFDCVPALYQHYQELLTQLSDLPNLEKNLRSFELHLLQETGFAIEFLVQGKEFVAEEYYHYHAGHGFALATSKKISPDILFLGEHLLKAAAADWQDPAVLKATKYLCRLALRAQLGNRPLNSSAYFVVERGVGAEAGVSPRTYDVVERSSV